MPLRDARGLRRRTWRHVEPVLILALLATGAGLAVAHGRSTAFLTVLNDFWGNAFAADYWRWTPAAIWNGFFPPGYPFLLTVLPGPRLIESAYYANVAAGVLLLAAVAASMRRLAADRVALVATALVAAHPMVIAQVLTTGPDALFVTCAVAGALWLFEAVGGQTPVARRAWLAGGALAAAGWLRFHAFPWAGALLVAAVVTGGRARLPMVWRAALPVGLAGAALAALGISAGDLWSVQRDQAFNVYTRLVEPPNWFHLPAREALPATIGEAIARNPGAFWANYRAFTAPHVWLAVPSLAALLFGRDLVRRFGAYTLVASLLFVPIVDLGASPRGIASVVPLAVIAGAWVAVDLVRRAPRGLARNAAPVLGALAAVWLVSRAWLPEILEYRDAARSRARTSAALEAALRADRVRAAAQVFATAEVYFLGAPGWQVRNYHPWIIGGWPSLDLAGFLEVYPPPSTSSLDAFLDDCRRRGITHLALGAASFLAMPELGQVFDGRLASPRLAELPGIPGVRLFRIVA